MKKVEPAELVMDVHDVSDITYQVMEVGIPADDYVEVFGWPAEVSRKKNKVPPSSWHPALPGMEDDCDPAIASIADYERLLLGLKTKALRQWAYDDDRRGGDTSLGDFTIQLKEDEVEKYLNQDLSTDEQSHHIDMMVSDFRTELSDWFKIHDGEWDVVARRLRWDDRGFSMRGTRPFEMVKRLLSDFGPDKVTASRDVDGGVELRFAHHDNANSSVTFKIIGG